MPKSCEKCKRLKDLCKELWELYTYGEPETVDEFDEKNKRLEKVMRLLKKEGISS